MASKIDIHLRNDQRFVFKAAITTSLTRRVSKRKRLTHYARGGAFLTKKFLTKRLQDHFKNVFVNIFFVDFTEDA